MKKIIQVLIIFLIIPLIANAEEEQIFIKCPERIEENSEFKCEITGSSSYEISGIDIYLSLADGIAIKEFTADKSWIGEEYNNRIVLYTGENKIGDFPIGELNLKSNSKVKSNIVQIEKIIFIDKDFEEQNIDAKNVKESKSDEIKNTLNSSSKIKYGIIIVVIIILIFTIFKNKKKIYKFIRKES